MTLHPDEQARELVIRYDQRCAAIRKLDPEWLEREITAILARVRLAEAELWNSIRITAVNLPFQAQQEADTRLASLRQAAGERV